MISVNTVLKIHSSLIKTYGGADGVRDSSSLESAINRPYATFDGVDLYPTAHHKASALFQSILINHPFIDGNKRTAFALMFYILRNDQIELNADESELYEFVISCSKGEQDFDQILNWIQQHTTNTKK